MSLKIPKGKSPASNDCAAIFKNADFFQSFLKTTKLSKL